MVDLPHGTVTFLFTDIEGSTALLRRLGSRYAEALEDHLGILRAAVADHDGHEIDTQGDALFAAFTRATDAVEAAVQAQRASGRTAVRCRCGWGCTPASPPPGESASSASASIAPPASALRLTAGRCSCP